MPLVHRLIDGRNLNYTAGTLLLAHHKKVLLAHGRLLLAQSHTFSKRALWPQVTKMAVMIGESGQTAKKRRTQLTIVGYFDRRDATARALQLSFCSRFLGHFLILFLANFTDRSRVQRLSLRTSGRAYNLRTNAKFRVTEGQPGLVPRPTPGNETRLKGNPKSNRTPWSSHGPLPPFPIPGEIIERLSYGTTVSQWRTWRVGYYRITDYQRATERAVQVHA